MIAKNISDELKNLSQEFASWHASRPYARSRVPAELLGKVISLSKRHSLVELSRASGIGVQTLEKGMQKKLGLRLPAKKKSETNFPVTLVPIKMPAPVEAPKSVSAAEIVSPSGWRVILHGSQVEQALKILMEHRP